MTGRNGGKALAPMRNEVVIATKFGWNIDQETGERRPGLDSRPKQIRTVVDGMLKRLDVETSPMEGQFDWLPATMLRGGHYG